MRTIKTILAIMMIAALCAGGVVLAEEPTAKIITPNNPEIDIEALADGEYPAAFEPAALADGELTFTVYWEDTFDVVEISQLAPGDTLYVGDTVVDVETVEQDDGDLLINGGLDNGGVTLRPYDEDLWAQVRGPLMRVALREKFLQNPALREQLLSTGNALLVEAAPRDGVWGAHMGLSDPNLADPATWDGKNLLGQTLMDVRSDLRGWARDLAGKSLDADGLALGSELADMTLAQVYRLPEAHVLVRAYACICAFRQDLRWTNSREFLGAQHGTLAQIDDAIRAGATDALPADGWHQLIHELDLRILAQSLGAR